MKVRRSPSNEHMIMDFVSFRGLSRRVGVPIATLHGKIRELGIMPDGVVSEPRRSTMLFKVSRLPKLRRQLLKSTVQ